MSASAPTTPAPPASPPADKLWYFKSAPLFAGAGHSLLARLAAASTMRRVGRRQVIYHPGARSDVVYLLKAGQVRLFRVDDSGREMTIAVLGPLDLFGERALAGEEAREEGAEAMAPSLICDIPRGDFLAALETAPGLAMRVSRLFALRTRRLECRLADLVFKGAEARLCTALLQLAEAYGRPSGYGAVDIPLTMTAREVGRLAGLGRPTASTLLAGLRREGVIAWSPWRTRLFAPDTLRDRANR